MQYVIRGGVPLAGDVVIGGAKNAGSWYFSGRDHG